MTRTAAHSGVCVAVLTGVLWHVAACTSGGVLDAKPASDDGGSLDGSRRDGGGGAPSEPDATVGHDARVHEDASEGVPDASVGDANADAGSDPLPTRGLYFKASNPDAQDAFGDAIALTDRWLAVGAPKESSWATGLDGAQLDDSEDDSGAVYLFSNDASGWSQRHYVKASNAGSGDGFGTTLALQGSTLVVGAPYEDSPSRGIDGDQGNGQGGNHGAVYIFGEQDGTWRQEAYVKASNTDWVDLFGWSVALDGDTLVVGAPFEDSGSGIDGDEEDDSILNCGAAYVFERTSTGWAQAAYLKASNPQASDDFGSAVAIAGATIAVGARGAAMNSGAVYVFELDGGHYREAALLTASDAAAETRFGSVVALHGDTLAVGSPGATAQGRFGSALDGGAVYVFERSAGAWSQTARLQAEDPIERTLFGIAVAMDGDELLVGAIGDGHPEAARAGTAYLFRRTQTRWSVQTRLLASNASFDDHFGRSVALAPTRIAVGATNEASNSPGINGDASNDDTPGAGAVFLFAR